jgi:uncharacterized protein (DUF305 family)
VRLPALRVLALVAALCFLAGSVGYVLGRGRPPGEGSADVGFLHDMLRHHEQAVELANLELSNGSIPDVRSFAREILLFQSYEIGLMDAQLQDWGYRREDPPDTAMAWMGHSTDPDAMLGMATPEQVEALREAEGREADALFLDLMQAHHRGGVQMAAAAEDLVRDDDVRELAARIASVQRTEIEELEAARERHDLP